MQQLPKIITDSETFWQTFNKLEGFTLSMIKDGIQPLESGYLNGIPVYIVNNSQIGREKLDKIYDFIG